MTRCAMHRAVLSARELSYAIAGRTLLDAVTLSLEEGERVALVGDNGAGKSTLLALLVGELPADGGEVRLAGAARIGLLSQEPRLDPGASVLDVVRSGLGEHDALLEEHTRLCHENAAQDEVSSARIVELTERIEAGAGFDVEHRVEEVLSRLSVTARVEKVSSLSGGERRRVDLARLLLEAPDVLLLDEPTNHLDAAAVSWLAEHLKARRGALLFTSHDRAFIDVVTTGILELDEGKLFKHDPPYASFVEGRMLRKDTEGRSADKRKRMMARELAWLRAGTPARTTKQNARIERAEALIDEVKHDVERRRQKSAELVRAKSQRLANTILELRAVTVAFGDRVLVDNLTLTLVEGERWGLVGPNGAGKTSLLRVVTGELAPTSGSVVRGGKTRFGLFDQHRRSLDPDATLDEVLADGGDWVTVDEEKVHVCTYLERYLFRGDDRKRKVSTLSGGEQNRLLLAKLLKQGANCLLLDEPTNDLDVSTLGLLEDALLDHPGVALIVSHDRSFLDRVCTGILAFEGNRVVPYQGDYSTYLRLKAGQEAREAESSEPSSQRPSSSSSASDGQAAAGSRGERKKKRSFKEEREYERIEQDVLVAEARREELSALLQGSAGTDASRAGALAEELAAIEAEVERLYARWQELEGYGG